MNESIGTLKTILKLATRNASEDLFFKGVQSALGILFKGGLQLALGRFAIMISFADLVTILARAGYKAYKEVQKTKISGTFYNMHTSTGGVLVAENPNVITLKDLPILLPEKASFPIHDVIGKSTQDTFYSSIRDISIRQLDSAEVFKSLSNMRGEGERYHCVKCSQIITISNNGAQVGHAAYCSSNINRYADWCDECKKDLRFYKHDLTCRRAMFENLRRPPTEN